MTLRWIYCAACDLAAIRARSYLARCEDCARALRRATGEVWNG